MAGHHDEYQVHRAKILTPAFYVLLFFTVLGFLLIAYRFVMGIGAVSNLSDGYPWGIWIAYDVATSTAFACGGYAMALVIYIMNRMKYHPLIRSALVTSMFGYMLAGMSVMVDVGRYWNAYSFFIPSRWQPNSVMFEVAVCIMAYNVVLIIEVLPAILERFIHMKDNRFPKLKHYAMIIYPKLDKVLIFIVILGITLPSMHQSSLGSMLIIAKSKLNPIWHTEILPLLFIINALYIGYATVIFESFASSMAFRRPFEKEVQQLSRIIPYVTGIWLTVRFIDLYVRGQLSAAFAGDFYSWMFMAEMLLILTGTYILMWNQYRRSPRMVFIAAMFLLIGGGWFRFNVYLIGFKPHGNWSYFPSLPEFFITIGLVAFEILGYMVLVKLFPIMPKVHGHEATAETAKAH
ncbi:Ni/Fe-hydrogenase cytochrome b subunit [Seleniivibrio woodruffii]|uniref:Ni/Fe-hydrogenase cytochrome b subunit n=1 Tax=Seleniivibrio woodruffii TaxID=1078050 RepID=UPI0026F20F89|nr:Ni/Fe-hydrogenase cytochrome b subunit [Seleniivibrio woodruffii]